MPGNHTPSKKLLEGYLDKLPVLDGASIPLTERSARAVLVMLKRRRIEVPEHVAQSYLFIAEKAAQQLEPVADNPDTYYISANELLAIIALAGNIGVAQALVETGAGLGDVEFARQLFELSETNPDGGTGDGGAGLPPAA